jgi:hypothetical protein
MVSFRDLKQEEKCLAQQQQVLSDLNVLARDIERSEQTIVKLTGELAAINAQFQGPRNTRQDVAYLTALLDCARKKLAWEKQITSLRKRTPTILQTLQTVLNEPLFPPAEATRAAMLEALQRVQAAMERLEQVNVS